jgi:ABC-2 type transport system permease protein
MLQLLRTEWLKIKNYRAFWLVMSLTALSYPGINYIFFNIFKEFTERKDAAGQIANMFLGNPFAFPEIWRTTAYASSFFVFIPAIVVIMLITNEYTYKTSRQNIIDGWDRNQFMASKLLDVLIITGIIVALYITLTVVIGVYNNSADAKDKWSLTYYIGLFALQTFAQLSIAFMVGFLVRKAFIALGIFVFYFIILEPMGMGLLKKYTNDLGRFLPLEISDRIIPPPSFVGRFNEEDYKKALDQVNIHILYTFLLIAIVWSFCFWLNKKRDL